MKTLCEIDKLSSSDASKDDSGYPLVRDAFTIKSSVSLSSDCLSEFRDLRTLSEEDVGSLIWVRARIHTSRLKGKQCFLVLRTKITTCQALVSVSVEKCITKACLKALVKIPPESVIDVCGRVEKAPFTVSGCTIDDIEIHIEKVIVISRSEPVLPLQIEDAMRPVNECSSLAHVNQDTRLDFRILDLRTPANQAIYAIEAGVAQLFREQFAEYDFTEIFTPKIIGAASEGGANVFKVQYFKSDAYLAQSPQLYKQMAIAGDFDRVGDGRVRSNVLHDRYTIGAVFRAENSLTHRHLTEFVGVDCEMSFKYHYHEALQIYAKMLTALLTQLQQRFAEHVSIFSEQFPFERLRITHEPLIIKYEQALEMLRADGVEIEFGDDFSATCEKRLGCLIKEKYMTDFFILDKYPITLRPFYTMPDANDKRLSNSFDMFLRGEEIASGAQRVHDPQLLTERIIENGIDPESLKDYIDAFKYGCSPHAGMGIGLERVVMLFLGLGNIRYTSLFPRDPKRLRP